MNVTRHQFTFDIVYTFSSTFSGWILVGSRLLTSPIYQSMNLLAFSVANVHFIKLNICWDLDKTVAQLGPIERKMTPNISPYQYHNKSHASSDATSSTRYTTPHLPITSCNRFDWSPSVLPLWKHKFGLLIPNVGFHISKKVSYCCRYPCVVHVGGFK